MVVQPTLNGPLGCMGAAPTIAASNGSTVIRVRENNRVVPAARPPTWGGLHPFGLLLLDLLGPAQHRRPMVNMGGKLVG